MIHIFEILCIILAIMAIPWDRNPGGNFVRQHAALWMTIGWGAFRMIIPHEVDHLVSSHPLAWSHILFSLAASIFMVCSCVCIFTGLHVGRLLRISLTYQGIGIVLGMLWAYEAPDWGMFWQWDFVEISSLYLWMLLYILHSNKSGRQETWGFTIISIQIIQTLALYTGLSSQTRHAYSSSTQMEVWIGLVLWLVILFAVCAVTRKSSFPASPHPHTRSSGSAPPVIEATCAWLMIGTVLLCGMAQISLPVVGIAILSLGLWVCIHLTGQIRPFPLYRARNVILGGMTLAGMTFLPVRIQDDWVKTDSRPGEISLQGIEVVPGLDSRKYHLWVGTDSEHLAELSVEIRPDGNRYSPPAYYLSHSPVMVSRIQALDYRADLGAKIRIRDCRLDLAFCLWILVLLGFTVKGAQGNLNQPKRN